MPMQPPGDREVMIESPEEPGRLDMVPRRTRQRFARYLRTRENLPALGDKHDQVKSHSLGGV
jgi:hypothetical protein